MSKNRFSNDIYEMYEKEALKNEKLTQLYDLTDRINQLQNSMSNSNGKSR